MSGKHALTEYESKRLLSDYGLKTTRDAIVHTAEEALEQADVFYFCGFSGSVPNSLLKIFQNHGKVKM